MKAISLHQPWATLLASGKKRIETRSSNPKEITAMTTDPTLDDDDIDAEPEPDDETTGSCDNCGCNLHSGDDDLCEQCAWWAEQD